MEGQDRRAQLGAKKWSNLGKNVGIMLQMCDTIFGSVNSVVLDSGFCVEKFVTALEQRGVYDDDINKKYR